MAESCSLSMTAAASSVSTSRSMSAIVSRRRRYRAGGSDRVDARGVASEPVTRSTMSWAVPRRMRLGGRARSSLEPVEEPLLRLGAHALEVAHRPRRARPPPARRASRCQPGATARRRCADPVRAPGAASRPTAARRAAAARSSAAGLCRPARQASRRWPCPRRAAAAELPLR